jgi:hypothetical protein
MRFWPGKDSSLERRLRDERPQAPEELVRRLAPQEPQPAARPPRRAAPRVVAVAAFTTLLAVSLGVGGAFGYATHSLQAFGGGLDHFVSPKPNQGNQGNQGDPGNDGFADKDFKDGNEWNDPFHHQYGIQVPICHDGQIIFVPLREYFWRLLHGDKPWFFCFGPHH